MKKFLLLIPAFLLAFQISKSQTEKGTQTLGVNVTFHSQKTNYSTYDPNSGSTSNNGTKFSGFGFGPSYSYFVANKLDVGVGLGYDYSTNENGPNSVPAKSRQYDYSGQIFLRKYFMYNDKIGLRAGPYAGYSKYNFKNTYTYPNLPTTTDVSVSDNYQAGVNVGVVYYPAKNIGISTLLANVVYQHSKSTSGTSNQSHGTTNTFDASFISSNLGLSLFYVFGTK